MLVRLGLRRTPTNLSSKKASKIHSQHQLSSKLNAYKKRTVAVGFVGAIAWIHYLNEYCYEFTFGYGISMLPTINSSGDCLITNKFFRRGRGIQVGDLVSYNHPVKGSVTAVKRVIGLPGDFVLRDTPGAGEGLIIQVPKGHCWVVGDNLSHSRDSRHFGPLPQALIIGKVTGVLEARFFIIPWVRQLDTAWI